MENRLNNTHYLTERGNYLGNFSLTGSDKRRRTLGLVLKNTLLPLCLRNFADSIYKKISTLKYFYDSNCLFYRGREVIEIKRVDRPP